MRVLRRDELLEPHKHQIADYLRPKSLTMMLLGFSSGLPFLPGRQYVRLLVGHEHTSLMAIGFLSWVGIAYSLKFLAVRIHGSRRLTDV